MTCPLFDTLDPPNHLRVVERWEKAIEAVTILAVDN
jgi:hypothetical protein